MFRSEVAATGFPWRAVPKAYLFWGLQSMGLLKVAWSQRQSRPILLDYLPLQPASIHACKFSTSLITSLTLRDASHDDRQDPGNTPIPPTYVCD
jgi:hypothetical protein